MWENKIFSKIPPTLHQKPTFNSNKNLKENYNSMELFTFFFLNEWIFIFFSLSKQKKFLIYFISNAPLTLQPKWSLINKSSRVHLWYFIWLQSQTTRVNVLSYNPSSSFIRFGAWPFPCVWSGDSAVCVMNQSLLPKVRGVTAGWGGLNRETSVQAWKDFTLLAVQMI